MAKAIGIIAGSGQFPFLVANNARAQGYEVVICGIHGNTDPEIAREASAFLMLHVGQFSTMIEFMKNHGVEKLCMAGAVNKPKALDLRPDWRAAKLLMKLAARHKGDDAILRAIAEELASEGIEVVRPDILVQGLTDQESGVLTKIVPPREVWEDIRLGWTTAKALGTLDVGQCVVVKQGVIVALEAIEGTDAVLERAAELAGEGCTIVKAAKPGQDERVDLPSVGKHTVELAIKYGFLCLAYESGRTLFFDKEESLALADEKGLSIVGIPPVAEVLFAKYGTGL